MKVLAEPAEAEFGLGQECSSSTLTATTVASARFLRHDPKPREPDSTGRRNTRHGDGYGQASGLDEVFDGACADNAAMKRSFALLQKNVLDRRRWRTRAELRLAIVTWIERTYHRKRRQRRLGTLTPIEFETINRAAATA